MNRNGVAARVALVVLVFVVSIGLLVTSDLTSTVNKGAVLLMCGGS